MLPISICMIAKNEAHYLEECLKRLHPYGFELIVLDTGSSDNTLEIAKQYTTHVDSFTWVNDFSAARNESLRMASNEWVLVVDCDEYLTHLDVQSLLALLPTLNPATTIGTITLTSPFQLCVQESLHTAPIARFFAKSHFHYEGSIHEQIVSMETAEVNDSHTLTYPALPCTFYHEGYGSEEILRKKSERNIQLLLAEIEQGTPSPYLYFQLGQSYFTLAEYEQALHYFSLAFAYDMNPKEEYVQTMVTSYGYSLLNLKRCDEALQFLDGIYPEFSPYADFLFLVGLVAMNNGLFQDAIAQFELATACESCHVEGVNSYSAYYNIGVIYECTGQIPLARDAYHKATNYPLAIERLQQL